MFEFYVSDQFPELGLKRKVNFTTDQTLDSYIGICFEDKVLVDIYT